MAGKYLMRALGKWLGYSLLALGVMAGAIGLWKHDEISRLYSVNSLFDANKVVANFSNMNRAFLSVPLAADAPTSSLPMGSAMDLPPEMPLWLDMRNATSLVVLKDGALVHESYYQDTSPQDLRIGWSMSKSFISALTGIVLAEGAISSLDDPVKKYAPQLAGGAYDGATLRNVLNMSTGVTFNEDYLDYYSDINRMGRVLALGGLMDDFTISLKENFATPGTDWQYVSIDTHVLGMVIRGATGRSIPDLMSEKIIAPLGLEHAPYYLTDGAGVAFALGGLNLTTRDYARFGQMIAQGGQWRGEQIVPRDWVIASTTASAPTNSDEYGYGYQWWMPRDARPREYMARGIYGQYLYINEHSNVVIVLTAADQGFRTPEIQRENIEWFRTIADSL